MRARAVAGQLELRQTPRLGKQAAAKVDAPTILTRSDPPTKAMAVSLRSLASVSSMSGEASCGGGGRGEEGARRVETADQQQGPGDASSKGDEHRRRGDETHLASGRQGAIDIAGEGRGEMHEGGSAS